MTTGLLFNIQQFSIEDGPGIRNAGLIRLRSVEGSFKISRLQVALDYVLAKLGSLLSVNSSSEGVNIPLPVRREFAKTVTVKVLAWIDEDEYPFVVPALSLQPSGEQTLVGWLGQKGLTNPPPGSQVAANILTFEAISYQAKGRWSGAGRYGDIMGGGLCRRPTPPWRSGSIAHSIDDGTIEIR